MWYLPGPVFGAPERFPDSDSVSPFGSGFNALNVIAPVPPSATMVVLYGTFCVAFGSVPGVVISISKMPTPTVRDTLSTPSFARRKMLKNPDVVGTPDNRPPGLTFIPGGTPVAVQLTLPWPFAVWNWCENGLPTKRSGRLKYSAM